MATYFMLGSYSLDAVAEISAKRTKKAAATLKECGGKLVSGYALLGEIDLVLIVEFPGTAEAMQASVALTKMLGISFTTCPAVSVEDFDRMMEA